MKKTVKLPACLLAMAVMIMVIVPGCNKDDDDALKDIDGNVYKTIYIGGNTWMAENLRTTKFRDGSAIPLVTENTQWTALGTAAYCWPENNPAYKSTLGALYNGYAVFDPRGLCPTGWHIPSDEDWIDLELELGLPQAEVYTDAIRGEDQNVGGKLKALVNWNSPNLGADNSSGFTAYGTGYRRPPGEIVYFGEWTGYLTTSPATALGNYWMRYLGNDIKGIDRHERNQQYGYPVRCIKD